MEEALIKLFWAILPAIIVAIVLYYFNKSMKDREDAVDRRAELRKRESLLALKMQFANGKLTYAVAMAMKRGRPNGEVEEGIKAYEEAKSEYNKFINETHAEVIGK